MTIYGVYNIQLFGDLLAENLYKKNMFTRILSRNDWFSSAMFHYQRVPMAVTNLLAQVEI